MKIDLVLAGRDLVMRGFDVHAHLLERDDDFAADVFTEIDRREIEVAGRVVRLGGGLAVAAQEQEELGFRPRHHREAALGGEGDDVLQRGARAAGEGAAVGIGDVADQAADARAVGVGPGEDLEGRQVGTEIHVRLFDSDEAFDRRAVEHDVAVERFGELAVGDLDVLDDAEDVGELKAQELDALLLGPFEDLLLFAPPPRRPLRDCNARAAPTLWQSPTSKRDRVEELLPMKN